MTTACAIIATIMTCITTNGTRASLDSSVYSFSQATCTINEQDVILCTNVRLVGVDGGITLRIDLRNQTADVL